MADGPGAASGPPPCPICDHAEWRSLYVDLEDRLVGVPGRFSVWECGSCGVWRLWPIPENLADYYPTDYGACIGPLSDIGATRPWHHLAWRRSFGGSGSVRSACRSVLHRNDLARLLWDRLAGSQSAPLSILDYGAGTGRALQLARQLGMRAVGVDLSSHSLEQARSAGLDLRIGTYEDLPLGDERFDVVHLSHVLEHLVDPVLALRNLKRHLAPDGSLIVIVPNADSGPSRLFGRDWFALDAPRHLWGFTPASLSAVLERAGYDVEHVAFDGSGGTIYQSIRYAMGDAGGRLSLPDPPDQDVVAGLDSLAAYWNAQSAGDSMTIIGRIPA